MNHQSIIALTFLVSTLIIICLIQKNINLPGLLQKENSIQDKENSLTVNKTTSSKVIEQLKQRVGELGTSLDRLWCKIANIGSTGGFCLTEANISVGGNTIWDLKLCQALEILFGKSSVVDLGAGLGNYGKCFLRKKESIFHLKNRQLKKNMDNDYIKKMADFLKFPQVIKSWDGYDGAINVGFLSKGFIKQQDLSITNLWLGRTWDWVLSLEIGEHIPANYEDDFLDNVFRHGCKGIVLSWAVENQGGHQHVNERSNAYIKKKMKDRGMVNDVEAEKLIRKTVVTSWFKNTLMVFRYYDVNRCKKL